LTTITETITTSSEDDTAHESPDSGASPASDGPQDNGPGFTERPMIPVALLTAHPGNVREDKQADRAFCQSVAAAGIITPLEITTSPDHDGRQAGVDVLVQGCDLTERRMYVRLYSEQVAATAPALLAGYRSPFGGAEGTANPVVWGGLVITNSETGDGAAAITPRLVVQVCRNGMTITADSHRAVHLGGRLGEGVIDWSADTHRKNLELITAKARDAVARFLDPRYVQRVVAGMEADAAAPVDRPQEAIELVSQQLRFTDDQRNAILGHFIKGGSLTAGGVMHAVASIAQTLADAAHDLESQVLRVLQLAARPR
jgi:hypothetical protein